MRVSKALRVMRIGAENECVTSKVRQTRFANNENYTRAAQRPEVIIQII